MFICMGVLPEYVYAPPACLVPRGQMRMLDPLKLELGWSRATMRSLGMEPSCFHNSPSASAPKLILLM